MPRFILNMTEEMKACGFVSFVQNPANQKGKKKRSGKTNLVAHAKSHEKWQNELRKCQSEEGPTTDDFYKRRVSTKAMNILRRN